MSEKVESPRSGYIEVGENQELALGSQGNLIVKGDVGSTIRYKSNGDISHDATTMQLLSTGDLIVSLPYKLAITLEQIGGNAVIKGVKGNVSALAEIGGNLSLRGSDGNVQLAAVQGDVSIKQVGGNVSIAGTISGNVHLRHVADVKADDIQGDFNAKHISTVTLKTVSGNAVVNHANGDVHLSDVAGDCALAHIAGTIKVGCQDDIRVRGPFAPGKHELSAGSTLDLSYPHTNPLIVTADCQEIISKIDFEETTREGSVFSGRLGLDGPTVVMKAAERIRIRPIYDSKGESNFGGFADFEFDFGDIDVDMNELGDRISAELNQRMAELSSKIGPEIGVKAESALRKAQAAIDKAIAKMESEMAKAQTHASRPTPPPPPPKTPRSGGAQKSAKKHQSTTEAQLKILKMLEEGKINVDEANQLLAALG